MTSTQKNYSCREHTPFPLAGQRFQAYTDHSVSPAHWVCTHTAQFWCDKPLRRSHCCYNGRVDSSLHQLRLQNIHQHRAHSTGLLYLAYISDRSQTSCHSCQGWRSQGCHCIGMADMILQVRKVVQNSLLHTSHSAVLCTQQDIHHRSIPDSGLNGTLD